ncbi:anaerobic magnesium-protoporphyrin IX monomethyl ester cyclase [Clostridiales bacterium]|nr:anaerobic magnesium-protoporphyrin IX monomethyl ester cyclase [Clostridiales bacterium]
MINKVALAVITEKNNQEELGICYIGALLQKHNYLVTLFSNNNVTIIKERLEKYQPDFVGFCVYDKTYIQTINLCKEMKKKFPKLVIVLGGRKASDSSEEILKECDVVDYVITGEGEYAMLNLINNLNSKTPINDLPNLTYRSNGAVIRNKNARTIENLDTLPHPMRTILAEEKLNTANILSSRGCTQNCSFCSSPVFWESGNCSKRWRGRDTMDVLNEIREIYEKYNIRYYKFLDCSFEDPDYKLERSMKMAKLLLDSGMDISYMVQFRPDIYKKALLKEGYMQTLVESGLAAVFIGIEAGNDDDLALYNKGVTVNENYACLDYFSKYDILVKFGFISINPFSTVKRLRENVDFLYKTRMASRFYMIRNYQVIEKSSLFKKLKDDGLYYYNENKKIHDYVCKDKTIDKMSKFAIKYFNQYNGEKLYVLKYFIEIFDEKIAFIKSYYKRRNPSVYDMVESYNRMYLKVMNDLNEKSRDWFVQLLDLAETGWDEKLVERVVQKVFPYSYLDEIYTKMLIIHKELYKYLLDINVKDANYLLYV